MALSVTVRDYVEEKKNVLDEKKKGNIFGDDDEVEEVSLLEVSILS